MVEFAPIALNLALKASETRTANKQARSRLQSANADINNQRAAAAASAKERLRRTQAAQRANFGAMGVDPHQGSARAVLEGLDKAVDRDLAQDKADAQARINANVDRYRQTKRKNLLALSAPYERMVFGRMKKELSSINLLD